VIGKISAITKTIPERKDIEKMTAEFDQMMDLYRGGGAVLIVLENSDLTSEEKTTEALREALIKITPEEFRTYQDTKKNAEKVINRIR
jgi:site-specific DNA-adenine methylase